MTSLPLNPRPGLDTAPSLHPPRVHLAFRVGIVGHRPNRLGRADLPLLGEHLRGILAAVREAVGAFQQAKPDLYAGSAPNLRAVTPLAEGTDRVFAEQALGLGFALCCPLPYAQAEYERDFQPPKALEPDSLGRFRGLLDQARAGAGLVCFELDGERTRSGAAYGAAGQVVLNQSDLLIAVWDGGEPAGGGGTVDTLRDAISDRVPVLLIDACAPHGWTLVRTRSDLDRAAVCPVNPGAALDPTLDWDGLRALVWEVLDLGTGDDLDASARELGYEADRAQYFLERRPGWNPAVAWRVFRDLFGAHRLRWPRLRVPDFEQAARADWPDDEGVAGWVNGQLRPHYAWAGKLSGLYADRYRSAFVLAFPLAALAVLLALLPGAVHPDGRHPVFEAVCTGLELVVIGAILALIYEARRGRWHERWVDYRFLAETIRQLRLLIPLGGNWPFPRLPAHWETYGNPSRSWMAWHMRAIARATGLPSARVGDTYLRQCLAYVRQVVEGQRSFHEDNALRSERIDHHLHRIALWLLGATVVCILVHLLGLLHGVPALHHSLVGHVLEHLHHWGPLLILCCGAFPALGAALHGIKNQAELARVAKRSEAMASQLRLSLAAITRIEQAETLRSADVIPLAREAADLMVDEVLDWRVIFLDRPPSLPA